MLIEMLIILKVATAVLWFFVAYVCFNYFVRSKSQNPVASELFLVIAVLCVVPVAYVIAVKTHPTQVVLILSSVALAIAILLVSQKKRQQTERRGALKPENDEASKFGNLAEHAFEGIYLVDPESMSYVDVNPSGAAALKYKREDMVGMSLKHIHPDDMPLIENRVNEAVETGGRVSFVVDAVRSDGKSIHVEIALKKVTIDHKVVVLAVGRDLTRRQIAQRQLDQLNQLYQLLTLSNRAITRIKHRQQLSKEICDIAVSEGGFLLAWIGELNGTEVLPVCYSGVDDGYVNNLNINLELERYFEGPVVRSINEQKVICINNLGVEKGFKSLKDEALKRGFNSVASVPIFVGHDVCSVLVIYSSQLNVFNSKMANLLTNLSEDLSYAFSNLNLENQRRDAEKRLLLLSSAIDQSADAVAIMNAEGFIEYVNPRFSLLTGYQLDEIKGQSPSFLCSNKSESEKFYKVLADLSNGRKWRGEFHNRKKSGEAYWSMDTISPIKDSNGEIVQYVSTSEDYTALRQAQDKIEQLAFYDTLTGLPNRRLLHDRLAQATNLSANNYSYVAVLMLDIDKFKNINDSFGHKAGDELIKSVAALLSGHARQGDTVARLGGDEFIVVLSNIEDIKEVVHFAESLLESISSPMVICDQSVSITTSIGISLHPLDGDEGDDLLRCADLAMYHAKAEGRNNFQFYTHQMNERALAQLELERKLKLAIQQNAFQLFYQPQVDMDTGKVKGVEALIRWEDNGAFIPPDKFIPIAEESGLMEQIGEWVINQAVKEAADLNNLLPNPLTMAINLSASQFRDSNKLIQIITDQLKSTGLKPKHIELELTESMLIDDVEATIKTLSALRELGITLAIDDFGTGYSSLSYLKNLPIDILKIDRSFVKDIGIDASDAAITVAIITLAKELNMSVLAEGVETEGQVLFLEGHGCDTYQGYFYSKPLPKDKLIELLDR